MENSALHRRLEHDFPLQWGNRKRLRCVKVQVKSGMDVRTKRSAFWAENVAFRAEPEPPQPPRTPPNHTFIRASTSQPSTVKSMAAESVRVKSIVRHYSPEKGVRVNTRRHHGSNHKESSSTEETHKISMDADVMQEKASNLDFVWPKIVVALFSKEKEEDFMAIKGCKLPLRPKKRAKFIQKNLLLVSPGSWLCDLSQERYEVQEKKSTRKRRRRGLKGMGNPESDSD